MIAAIVRSVLLSSMYASTSKSSGKVTSAGDGRVRVAGGGELAVGLLGREGHLTGQVRGERHGHGVPDHARAQLLRADLRQLVGDADD